MSQSALLCDIEAVDGNAPQATDDYDSIYRFIRRLVQTREDAEDLTQDVFLGAVEALRKAQLQEADPSLAWLYTVARRRLVDRLRNKEKRQRLEGQLDLTAVQPDYETSTVETLLVCLKALDASTQRVIVMKLFEGRRFKEIAETLDVTEEACRARFSRGLAALRERLREKGVTP
jgi:RNA polymerase sigma-70 factor (ECF subfamily)